MVVVSSKDAAAASIERVIAAVDLLDLTFHDCSDGSLPSIGPVGRRR